MQECPFGILVWCSDGGFEGLVWYFNSVSEVMVVVVVFGWLVWGFWVVGSVVLLFVCEFAC